MSERLCETHKKSEIKNRNKTYDKYSRNKVHSKFYNSTEWRALRVKALEATGGLCTKCLELEIITTADVVDHITPIENDYSKRLDLTNLQPLCHSCHNRKTAEDEASMGRGA